MTLFKKWAKWKFSLVNCAPYRMNRTPTTEATAANAGSE